MHDCSTSGQRSRTSGNSKSGERERERRGVKPEFFCLVCYIRSVALKHLWRTCEVFNFTMTCKDRKMSEKGDSTTDTF